MNADATPGHAHVGVDDKARSRKSMLRLQHSANRSKWISSTERALYVHTEQQHWTSHPEVPMFVSRALFHINDSKRILCGHKDTLTRAAQHLNFSQVHVAAMPDAQKPDLCFQYWCSAAATSATPLHTEAARSKPCFRRRRCTTCALSFTSPQRRSFLLHELSFAMLPTVTFTSSC